MTRLTALAILLFALSTIASATSLRIMEQPEDAFELLLREVQLPGSAGGSVIFKACSECRTTALRTTSNTVFEVDNQVVDFAAFQQAAKTFRGRGNDPLGAAVYLFFNVDSRLVTRLELDSF